MLILLHTEPSDRFVLLSAVPILVEISCDENFTIVDKSFSSIYNDREGVDIVFNL